MAGRKENQRNYQIIASPVMQDMDKEITSKQLVRGAFESAELPRLPFIPWIFTHAARLEQIPVRRMFGDPTQYVKCLQNARKLYGYDAIIGSFDSSLEMEICGGSLNWRVAHEAPAVNPRPDFNFDKLEEVNVESAGKTGRLGTVIESLRRINIVSGKNLALAAVVSGPLTVTAGLTGRDLKGDFEENPEATMRAVEASAAFLLKVVKVYCQLQPDIIVIADRLMSGFPGVHLSWLQSALSPIVNTIRFYNAYSVLLPGEPLPENLTNLVEFGFDGIVARGIDFKTWNELRHGRPCILGKAIPSHLFTAGKTDLQGYMEILLKGDVERGVFLTTDWEVPPETPPENIRLVMNMISPGK
jgi:uroporphyrinogen-III decarboxylase